MPNEQEPVYLSCPFCAYDGFDAIGLKTHLVAGWCEPYTKTSIWSRLGEPVESDGK